MPDKTIASNETDRITKQCRAEYEAGLLFRRQREAAWQMIEDGYFNRVKKSLKAKFNVPVPIIPGFVDTWQSKMAKHADLKFGQVKESEFRATAKANAFLQIDKRHEDYDWDMADTDGKKLAALSGRAIYTYFASSKPSYKSTLDPVYHYDFIADPVGGGDLEKHRFVQRDNIFKNKQELKDGVAEGLYDASAVSKLINATKGDMLVNNDNAYHSKQNAFQALGLNGLTFNYAGQDLYKFIEAGTIWNGQRYYVLFNYETGIAIRCKPLTEVFKSGLWWFTSWATHRDTFNFWSKGPSDDMIPLAEMIRILVNQELDNRNKKNYGQRAFDPDVFPDPSQLAWIPDGLVATKAGLSAKRIQDGIYEFQTPELGGTIDLVQYVDNLLKEKTGVNSESQGNADTSKVGIAYLNVQQSTERTALVYESYSKCWQAIGRRYLWGLKEHMREAQAVKIIGEKGVEWDELMRTEINPEWDIIVEGGEDDANKDAMKKQALAQIFEGLLPDEIAVTNPKWRVKVKLQNAEVDDDEIRLAFDLQGDSDRAILSKASEMIEKCLEDKPIKPYQGATTAFVQKLIDYTDDNDLENDEYRRIMAAAQVHVQIAAKNAARKAAIMAPIIQAQALAAQMGKPGAGAMPAPAGGAPQPMGMPAGQPAGAPSPMPGSPGQVASQSAQFTNLSPTPNAAGPTPT